MTGFIDEYLPDEIITFPCSVSPAFSTTLTMSDSGDEQTNQNWLHPLRRFSIPDAVNTETKVIALRNHFFNMAGPAHRFPFTDPFDFASVPLVHPAIVPVISATDVTIGTGDGIAYQFQLSVPYVTGSETYSRDIELPVTDTVLIALDGVDPTIFSPTVTWTVSRPGGIVTFSDPIPTGTIITSGFLFDVRVRYEADDVFDQIYRNARVNGFGAFTLLERRAC